MFFIMGISQKEKKLNFNQMAVCKRCGRYGQIEVFMTYTYLMLFFIPVFKWNRHYYVKMSCCGAFSEIGSDLGRAIENGEAVTINVDDLNFGEGFNMERHCPRCGFTTAEDFAYCPKCGSPMQ